MFKLIFVLISALWIQSLSAQQLSKCHIFVHGYTSQNDKYFGELPRQVKWDSSLSIEKSAPEVAAKIIEQIHSCEPDSLVVLRPHSYGAAQVLYILGQGKRFQNFSPEHDFVKIYKRTFEVYSYTGAYHGTPLMDLVCSNKITATLGTSFGKSCVDTLTTSTVTDVANFVHSPGVPTYLIHSTNQSGYLGLLGTIIAKDKITLLDYTIGQKRNLNDNTLPLYATKACTNTTPLIKSDEICKKLDDTYFIDYHHTKKYNHTNFLLLNDFMLMEDGNE